VAERTLDRPPLEAPALRGASRPLARAYELASRRPAIVTAVGLLLVSFLIVLWAGTRPSFDAYGWLVWGHQTVAGALNTNAAPSWKPLPYLFTAPYALAGHYELWLWMITSVAISLSGVIFAGRIAYRLTPDGPRYAPIVAAVIAGAALLGIEDYPHYVLSFQSDPVIVSLCLGAIDSHLSGRRRWALALLVLAGLGRPEAWAFAALYALWAWRADPTMRWFIVGGLVVSLLLWFGIPALSSRSAFVAGNNAFHSGRALKGNKIFGTIDRFLDLHATALELAALLSLGLAVWRRNRPILLLTAAAAAWVVIEIAFALHGWPGLPRYMFEAGGVMVVLAGVGTGWLLAEARGPWRWAAIGAVAALVGGLAGAAISKERVEHKDLQAQRARTHQIDRLARAISTAGGSARIAQCGEPLTRLEYQTIVAWELRLNVATVGFRYDRAKASGRPIVLITPTQTGWSIQSLHQAKPQCQGLAATVS
jgi:hypothetical protein